MSTYRPGEQKIKEMDKTAALAGAKRYRAALKDLEKLMCHRTNVRDASVQKIKEQKAEHARLTKSLKNCLTKLENLGVKEE